MIFITVCNGEDEDRKVPPLRVKISQVVSQQKVESPTKEPKPFVSCPICNDFKSNNLYILGRHQKSCEKKMKTQQPNEEEELEQEVKDETIEDDNTEEDEGEDGDATIEVPVDFEDNESEEISAETEPMETNEENLEETEPQEPIVEMEIAQDETNEDHEQNNDIVPETEVIEEKTEIGEENVNSEESGDPESVTENVNQE